MKQAEFDRIDRALAAVLKWPEAFSEFEVEFADRNADRLGQYGLVANFSRAQWAVVERIETKIEEMET